MAGDCGSCTACCRVFAIPLLNKPAGEWCTHCAIGKGCKIYEARPKTCVEFRCVWLQSQKEPGHEMPLGLRPDKCKVTFSATTNPRIISATTIPGMNWRRKDVMGIISLIIANDMKVVVGTPTSTTKLMIDKYGEREVEMTEPDENGIQWNVKKGRGR